MDGNLNTDGYHFWEKGKALVAFQIYDRPDGSVGSLKYDMLYHPTEDQIAKVCEEYGLDVPRVLDLIRDMPKGENHTMIIDVQKFKESQALKE